MDKAIRMEIYNNGIMVYSMKSMGIISVDLGGHATGSIL